METPATSRPRRSRTGLLSFVLLLGLASWELVGRLAPVVTVTPLRFLRAAWSVASGTAMPGGAAADDGAASADGPSDAAVLAKLAFRPLPYVMYGLKPSFTREPQEQRDGTKTVKTSNRLGFRGREIEQPKPAGRYRIVCLGGSTTYSDAVSDADAYPLLLEQELRKALPGRDIEVINAGVPSYTTAETLPNLAYRCLDLQPDLIVLYEGINDYRPRVYRNFDSAYFHYRRVWNGSLDVSDWGPLEGAQKRDFNKFIQLPPPEPKGDKQENVRRSGTAAFRRNLTSIAGVAKEHGIRVAFVSNTCDPDNEFTEDDLVAGLAEENAVVKEVAAAQGALFIDLAASYQPKGQFADPVHMNAAGEAQMARLIAAGLLKEGL